MEEELCFSTSQCQSLYQCIDGKCVHNDIFPLSTYSIIVYIFMGLTSAFCNISGSSMGIFKMLILIMLLHYELDEATGLAQAMVVGTAFPNFITVILKKHPNQQTSLVNYKLLLIIIPCSLLGSTVGSLAQMMIPKIGQLSLLVLIFMYFTYGFIRKLKQTSKKNDQSTTKSLIESAQMTNAKIQHSDFQIGQYDYQRSQILQYEKSNHIWQILFTIAAFIGFESLSFLLQGKFPFYQVSKCSFQFCFGIVIIFGVTMIYLFILFTKMKLIYGKYKRYNISQEIYLDNYRSFLKITAGAFAAGSIQGLLGMGCGTCIMIVLLTFPIASNSASATSGYQILFTGAASLLQYYINGEVKMLESIWMLGVCLVIGGITTVILYEIIARLNQTYVNRFILLILVFLCLMSIGLVAPTVINILNRQGWAGLSSIDFKCQA